MKLIGLATAAALTLMPIAAMANHEPDHPMPAGPLNGNGWDPYELAYCVQNYVTNGAAWRVNLDCDRMGPFKDYATCRANAFIWVAQLKKIGARISWQSLQCAGPIKVQ